MSDIATIQVSPPRGFSSFEIAQQEGYTGTKAEWLQTVEGFYKYNLGALAADPATDRYGDPVTAGALYYNTASNAWRTFDGSVWSFLLPQGDYLLL